MSSTLGTIVIPYILRFAEVKSIAGCFRRTKFLSGVNEPKKQKGIMGRKA